MRVDVRVGSAAAVWASVGGGDSARVLHAGRRGDERLAERGVGGVGSGRVVGDGARRGYCRREVVQ